MEEDGGMLASIEQGGIFILPAQFYISSVARGNEIMTGYALFLLIEIDTVCYRMTGPSAKRMSHRRTVTACHGSDGKQNLHHNRRIVSEAFRVSQP